MTDSQSPHNRAVSLFGDLVQTPARRLIQRPSDLCRIAGRAPSTGYRVIAEAETLGLLKRGIDLTYSPGSLALRIGFSAAGFGELADVAEPVLTELREVARLTSVLAVVENGNLMIGPYSLGRGVEFLRPEPAYLLAKPVPPADDRVLPITLMRDDPGRQNCFGQGVVLGRSGTKLALILLLSSEPFADRQAELEPILRHAAGRFPHTGSAEATR
jgi:hypothetical protein